MRGGRRGRERDGKLLALLIVLAAGNLEAQIAHCKPDDRIPHGVICRDESPFDPPEVIAERERRECLKALVEEDAIIHQMAAAKSVRNTLPASKEILRLRDRHKELSRKIADLCWK